VREAKYLYGGKNNGNEGFESEVGFLVVEGSCDGFQRVLISKCCWTSHEILSRVPADHPAKMTFDFQTVEVLATVLARLQSCIY
jgi:hypothetical protein